MQQIIQKTLEILNAVEGGRINGLADIYRALPSSEKDAEWLFHHLEVTGDIANGLESYMLTRRGEEHLDLLRSILAPPTSMIDTLCETVEHLLEDRYPEVIRRPL